MERKIKVGRIYKHYGGRFFIVDSVEYDNEQKTEIVLYKDLISNTIWSDTISRFLGKVPIGVVSSQEYRFILADHIVPIKGKELDEVNIISNGYCSISGEKCMCQKFRSQQHDGVCDAGLFKKTWIGEQL